MRTPLPIDEHLGSIRDLVDRHRRLVLVAPPGTGKSTRVPPALLGAGPAFLLQPRRVAARSLAARIAHENGWTVGREVGFQVRFERAFSSDTRLLVATEGILTARLEADPLLAGYASVVLDEFHERSIHADLALAFLKQALAARADLRVVVMSATLGSEVERLQAFLDGCPVYEAAAPAHAVEVSYRPGLGVGEVVRERLAAPGRHLLCFLPGAREIQDAGAALANVGTREGVRILGLHGGLPAREQDAALAAFAGRKVVLATNIAETSLTIDAVTDVVDSGLHKVQRLDTQRGIDRLDTERISAASAAQRAGRAGRTGPGRAFRLWDQRDRLRPQGEPDVQRIDLAGALLDVLAWGGDPARFEWYETPPAERLRSAAGLLDALGATRDGRITALGRTLRRFPLPPRLARVLVEAGGGARAAACCAVLAERPYAQAGALLTDSDVLSRADRLHEAPPGVQKAAREIEALARRLLGGRPAPDDAALRRALLAGYPDRVARRRAPASERLVLASGHGAVLARESGVRTGELLLALDVTAGPAGPGSEALVRLASLVDPEWLEPVERAVTCRFEAETGTVRAVEQTLYRGLVLAERPVPPDPATAAEALADELRRRGPGPEARALLRRARFAGVPLDFETLVPRAVAGRVRLDDVDLVAAVPPELRPLLDRHAPERLNVPSGRSVPLEYRDDGAVVASVKLQELFGLGESPRVGPRGVAVTLELLAPNGRPVQTTRDLRGFWDRTYPEVRKELRGRYPKHPWPEDPWTAPPTHRVKPRKG